MMPFRSLRLVGIYRMPLRSFLVVLCMVFSSSAALCRAEPDDAGAAFFESKVRPILADNCFKCHSARAQKLKAGLYADSLQGLLKGGDNGPAIVPAHPEQSRLVEAIGYGNVDLQMPPKGKLSDQQIADLTQWIKMGAPWPGSAGASGPVASAKSPDVLERKIGRWAWQPVREQTPPGVKDAAWATKPIDRFILSRLEAAGLKPAPDAQKRALIRRACFDITGLPPTPQEVDAFVADSSPDAFAKLIDRLLDSPHFGERWARHWLDLVRYAEGYGHEFDYPIPNASQYRDYVIRAFNNDVPYNQFVIEQVAGDLLERPRMNAAEGYNESIIGTGFWFLGEQVHAPVDVRQHQADRVENQIDVFGKTFLGLTLACARCHDHKFDPIKQRDFYSLAGFLESTRQQNALLDVHGKIAGAVGELRAIREKGTAALRAALPQGDATKDDFARYLKAAGDVISGAKLSTGRRSVEDVVRDANLDPARLRRWVDACGEKGTNEPTHPLFAWSEMGGLAPDASPNAFAAERESAQRRWADQQKQAQETAAKSVVFKDFKDGNYNGWFASGWAFGTEPTRVGQWDSAGSGMRLTMLGVAHSGALAGRLKGVLRSPTFKLTHPQLLYHIAGTGARVHLVIDGYLMDTFAPLLFAGALFDSNTGGKFIWHRQSQDVGRYLGHSAYIEIIDDGDGFVAVDQIRFADEGSPEPAAAPSAVAGRILADAHVTSSESLAAAYGAAWSQALEQWRAGGADDGACALVNWALQHGLVEVNESAAAQLTECKKEMDAIAKAMPEPMRALAAADGTGIDERIFIRGNHKTPGEPAPRRFLEAIATGNHVPMSSTTSGRLELARLLTDPNTDPLIARVMVNRIWHHLLGRGIVASTDNFGALGQAPTHPELLDYMADRFVKDGWSIKKTIRAIMLSRTYQMASEAADAHAEQIDPDNSLLHRAHVRRLEAEAIRDEMLAVSGRLDPKLFGASVDVNLTAFMEGRGRPASGPLDGAGRRSIYLAERRNFLSPMMLAFDQPIPFSSMGRRSVSNVPAQALTLMNDPFVLEQAKTWATRMLADKDLSPEQRITRMYLTAFGRSPTDAERADAMAFIQVQGEEMGLPMERRLTDVCVWTDFAHAMMNAKEFIFLN
ncbi:MAG: Planctomycete cytochrome [Phycisphaerales bacterium]|nr:Planctomycete cytochrome [Phycisphaerales bacterium]